MKFDIGAPGNQVFQGRRFAAVIVIAVTAVITAAKIEVGYDGGYGGYLINLLDY
jgi:hypothetical protein